MAPSIGGGFIPSGVPIFDSIVNDKIAKGLVGKQNVKNDVFDDDGIIVGTTPNINGTPVYQDPVNNSYSSIPNHFTADRDPTNDDNYRDGWREGSKWYNLPNNRVWICVESTPSHVVWRLVESYKLESSKLEFRRVGPIEILNLSNNNYTIKLPQISSTYNSVIVEVVSVYVKDFGRILEGFGYDPVTSNILIDTSSVPNFNLMNKVAYLECMVRIGL